jgi:hypothetical protein
MLGLSFIDEISFLASTVVFEDNSSLGMGRQILLRHIDFGSFLMVAARRIILVMCPGVRLRQWCLELSTLQ